MRKGHSIFYRLWPSVEPARANVLIVHGMGEHSERYGELAAALNQQGCHVIAADLRGHGRSLPNHAQQGDMGYKGWSESLGDLVFLQDLMAANSPLPTIMIGHSMGTMLAQQYVCENRRPLAGLVLSGAPGVLPWALNLISEVIARVDAWRLDDAAASPFMDQHLFGANNRIFANKGESGDGFAWLTRDVTKRQQYVDDPMCGFVLSASALADMFCSQRRVRSLDQIRLIDPAMPIYLIAGAHDPVHGSGKGIRNLHRRYLTAGLKSEMAWYPQGRHEMFNETNREQVTVDLLHWINSSVLSTA